jgi:hypothetical protein
MNVDQAVEDVYNHVLSIRDYPPDDIPPTALYCQDEKKNPGLLTLGETLPTITTYIQRSKFEEKPVVLAHFLKKYGYPLLHFLPQYNIPWPPAPISTYALPGYIGETFFSAICRVYEKLMDPTESVRAFYESLKGTPEEIRSRFIDRVKKVVPGNFVSEQQRLKTLFQECNVVDRVIYSDESSIERHVGRIDQNPTFDDYAMAYVSLKVYTEIQTVEFISSVRDFYLTDSKDWRQQVFIIVPTDDTNVQTHTLMVSSGFEMEQKSFNDLATLQFQYDYFRRDNPKLKKIQLEGDEYSNIMQIQGYKMYEHAHFLMAVASGVKYASPKALALLPDLFNPVTQFTWLDARMAEWIIRIQSLPRVEKEIEQRQFEIVQGYIASKRKESTPAIASQQKQQASIQTKSDEQAVRMASNLGAMLGNLNRGVDPNIVFSKFDTTFKPQYALRLDPTNIASIKKRKTGFFFGESRKAYQPRLTAQLRALQAKLEVAAYQKDVTNVYEGIREIRAAKNLLPPAPLPSGTIANQIDFLTQQIRELKTQLAAQTQVGSGRRRFTRRALRRTRRYPSKKTKSRTRRA